MKFGAQLALRVVAGAALFGLAFWHVGPARLWEQLRHADLALFALAVGLAILSNVVSAVRWGVIARAAGLHAPRGALLVIYARGVTANLLLPGGLLPGDALRALQLSRLRNPFSGAAWSVALDRLSGFWMLCTMSLLAAGWLALAGAAGERSAVPASRLLVYCAALAAAVALPFLPGVPPRLLGRRLTPTMIRVPAVIAASAGHSCAVQLLAGLALWACALSVGLALNLPTMLAAAAPIFLMAALPLGVAGFGARELAAVVVLGMVGAPSEQAMAAGLLYGLAAVVQGVVAAPLFLVKV